MTNRDIYMGALSLTGDGVASEAADFESRAVVLLPMIVMMLAPLDRLLKARKVNSGEEAEAIFSAALAAEAEQEPYVSLDETWRLEPEFYACAAHYLAAALVAFEDDELADYLSSRADTLYSIIEETVPAQIRPIKQKR